MRILDGDGTYCRGWQSPVLGEEPAYDMSVFDIIRSKWVELRNQEIEAKSGGPKRKNKR